jgi:glycosyltransferase involved in cell wall biosynthesis
LIPPEDPIALATAVRHILNAPNNAIERSRSAKDRFSIERTAKAYADFYRTLGRP